MCEWRCFVVAFLSWMGFECKLVDFLLEKLEVFQWMLGGFAITDEIRLLFDVKWFPLKNIFREVIFPENIFCRKHFTLFTTHGKSFFFFEYFHLIILTYKKITSFMPMWCIATQLPILLDFLCTANNHNFLSLFKSSLIFGKKNY